MKYAAFDQGLTPTIALVNQAQTPLSKVFVKTTLAAGEKVSVTAAHELKKSHGRTVA